ncbi:MAG TPA: autotransporter-associated beta strand repeat-containing protein, partial [Luteolibacter sp.]|nr:autotransporter-associated beta strand repeat-containing protein [Luteolibacter sp.]
GTGRTLILSHPTATHTLNFRNGISFSTQKRTVQVEDGAAAVDAILSGVLIGTADTPAGLNKTGPGVLSLTNANTYPGTTTVGEGVLRLDNSAALPSGNLELTGGGILGLGAGDFFNRTIGTGADQLRWSGDGGFAAFGADRVVRFTPEPDTSARSSINWIETNFIGSGRALILGHETSDATIDWQQRISLAGTTRIIQVEDGSADIDAKMSGIVAGGTSSNTNNRFNKTGPGTLAFTAQHSYWGNTIVSGGTLMIGDGGNVGGASMNSAEIIVEAGATLAVNRANTVTQGSNPFKAPVTGDGGFAQIGAGNTVLTLANSYIGPTRIDAGTLTLGAAGVLPDGTEVVIGNATLDAGTVAETAGRLDIDGPATIHLGAGAALAFADSGSVDWTGGTLDLTGDFVSGVSLRFGNDSGGLSLSQLALISADGFTNFALDADGYLTAGAPSGFETWIAGVFANGSVPIDRRGPNDDFDNDGVPSLVEFALAGQDPTVADPKVGDFTGNTLSFTKRPGADGITYAIETSTDLGQTDPWAEVGGASYVNDPDTISYDLPDGPPRAFLRLRVSLD